MIPNGENIAETKICQISGERFHITDKDLEFYDKVSPVFNGKKYSIPTPKLCPDERMRRRMAWRNDRNFYSRKCSATGKKLISAFGPSTSFPLYEHKYWWSDAWSALDCGRKVDFERPFFDQFMDLHSIVPQIPMINDNGSGSENCEYCYDFAFGKDCYFAVGMWEARDCLYCMLCDHGDRTVDCERVLRPVLSYECMYSQRLTECIYILTSSDCERCFFGEDLIGCRDCFMCFGLRSSKYCILNKQYTKDEYEKKMQEIKMGSFKKMQEYLQRWFLFSKSYPKREVFQMQTEECSGDMLFNCHNNHASYCMYNSKNCRYFIGGDSPKNSYDIYNTGKAEWCYEGLTPDNSHNTSFSTWCWKCSQVMYCDNCHSSNNLIGCISLKRQKHCILNSVYSKQEYETIAGKLIDHMIATGEWGEFFPITKSPYPYNDSVAQDYFPLSEDEAKARGLLWKDTDLTTQSVKQSYTIPDNIADVDVDICQEPLVCQESGKAFKIQKNELAIYKTLGVPIPRLHPTIRRSKRLAIRNSHKLYSRKCDNCSSDIQTIHTPETPGKVFCKRCYDDFIGKYPT